MDCQHVQQLIEEYRENTLDEALRSRIQTHLVVCDTCRRVYMDAENLGRLLSRMPGASAPDDFEDRLRRQIQSIPAVFPSRSRRFSRRALLVAATIVFFVGAVTIFQVLNLQRQPDASVEMSERPVDIDPLVLEIPIESELYQTDHRDYIRFISKDTETGDDVFIQMPASYPIRDFQKMETVYLQEVSH